MKIVADDKIPFLHGNLEVIADEVIYKPGAQIKASDVRDADALIVRTRTQCNKNLLENSTVRFIATATIGYDHLDTDYLKEKGIEWANCPGCNANSVAQYIYSCLLLLEIERGLDLHHTTIGLIGAGHVGTAVKKTILPLGVEVLINDPPLAHHLAQSGKPHNDFLPLNTLQQKCDILSFHTPLTHKGPYATFHMADNTFFNQLKRKPLIINTSRGEVISTEALLNAMKNGKVSDAIIDTWENEPEINAELLHRALIATPHIAGYSADGKANAARMTLEALCKFFNINKKFDIHPPALHIDTTTRNKLSDKALALLLYDPRHDSNALKSHPNQFEHLRENYPLRRESLE